MVPVTQDQFFKLGGILRAGVEQAVFIQDQHSQAVTGIQEFRGGRIVAGPAGIDSHIF
jgi:hypothetical protein